MIELFREWTNVLSDGARAMGVTPTMQRKAIRLSGKSRSRRRPSQAVLKVEGGLSSLLTTWRRDARYIQPDGTPKALPILGAGASLESLVKFCVPDLDVNEVVQILCTHSDVQRLQGGKVALQSHSVKITQKNPATVFAWLITQVRHLSETIVHNAKIPSNAKGVGRYERQIFGSFPSTQFEIWSQEVRKLLQEAALRVEATLPSEERVRHHKDEKICGVGMYVFREDGDIG